MYTFGSRESPVFDIELLSDLDAFHSEAVNCHQIKRVGNERCVSTASIKSPIEQARQTTPPLLLLAIGAKQGAFVLPSHWTALATPIRLRLLLLLSFCLLLLLSLFAAPISEPHRRHSSTNNGGDGFLPHTPTTLRPPSAVNICTYRNRKQLILPSATLRRPVSPRRRKRGRRKRRRK